MANSVNAVTVLEKQFDALPRDDRKTGCRQMEGQLKTPAALAGLIAKGQSGTSCSTTPGYHQADILEFERQSAQH